MSKAEDNYEFIAGIARGAIRGFARSFPRATLRSTLRSGVRTSITMVDDHASAKRSIFQKSFLVSASVLKQGIIGGGTFAMYGVVRGQQSTLFPMIPLATNSYKSSKDIVPFVANATGGALICGMVCGLANGLVHVAWDKFAIVPTRVLNTYKIVPDGFAEAMAKNKYYGGSMICQSLMFGSLFAGYEAGKRASLATLGLQNTSQDIMTPAGISCVVFGGCLSGLISESVLDAVAVLKQKGISAGVQDITLKHIVGAFMPRADAKAFLRATVPSVVAWLAFEYSIATPPTTTMAGAAVAPSNATK